MLEKAERFAPGAGKKHREKADAEYAAAVRAGNSERDLPDGGEPAAAPAADAPDPGGA